MSNLDQIKTARLKKLETIKKAGLNAYPAKAKRTCFCQQAFDNFDKLIKENADIFLNGRLMSVREHGGSTFCHIEDATGRLQIYFKKDILGDKKYRFFLENFDIGDFIEVKGILFATKKGEKTLKAEDFKILAKSVLPLPEKWHGLKDVEERFRKRYLDLIMNKQVRDNFAKRSQIIKLIRQFLENLGFMEVETPMLQTLYGGAMAKPFKTHLNALDLDLYLRIAPELYLKRLLVGGFEKVYEIGRCFRNEGLDSHHNPEFTMLEFYWSYADYQDLMNLTEEMFEFIVSRCHPESRRIVGTKDPVAKERDSSPSAQNDIAIFYQGNEISFNRPFKRIEFSELGKTDQQIKEKIKEIIQPTFIINHPIELSPLAKQLESDTKKAARFQLVAGGLELINAFSELNDPQEQQNRFRQQEKERQAGDKETQPYDKDFLEALEYGMPPAAGFGMGIDRLAALLTDSHSLREIILFPTMKPK